MVKIYLRSISFAVQNLKEDPYVVVSLTRYSVTLSNLKIIANSETNIRKATNFLVPKNFVYGNCILKYTK